MKSYYTISEEGIELLTAAGGFVAYYPGPRPNDAHQIFFTTDLTSSISYAITPAAFSVLFDDSRLVPELDDKEYNVQKALGSVDYRVYKVLPTHPMFIDEKGEVK